MSTVMTEGVEIGGSGYAPEEAPKTIQEKPSESVVEAADDGEEPALELSEDDEVIDEAEDDAENNKHNRPGLPAKERIAQLNREKRELERQLKALKGGNPEDRIDRIEKLLTGEIKLQDGATYGNNVGVPVPPDPTDLEKYRLGSLDDRYIEDLTEFKVEQKLAARHQRQVEDAQKAEAARVATESLQKAQSIVTKGVDLYPDYEEVVWEAGMRGDYRLEEPTFLAITEAEHGAEIAYALARNKAEAARVATLSPYQQIKYVADKNAEFAAKKSVRLPKADTPPAHTARGSSSRSRVDPSDLNTSLSAISKELFR